jgi:hypothetical protein
MWPLLSYLELAVATWSCNQFNEAGTGAFCEQAKGAYSGGIETHNRVFHGISLPLSRLNASPPTSTHLFCHMSCHHSTSGTTRYTSHKQNFFC